ncbi:MAG: fasciclin domain-containing protein [Cytophagales bacterium]|nr:MAG: fasciclin domain-containing protein [Cytophagales bacterium]
MKKLLSTLMVLTVVLASSFTNKTASVHEVDADIVDLAVQTEFLSTLVAAVKAGDLVDVLKGDGPFTVFAPTNDAFAKLPAGTVENLLKPENKAQLVAVLTYHVVPGKVMSSTLKDGMKAKTVQGQEVTISLKDGKAMVNNATVTAADIEASNGVVHVIDTVILPSM